MLSSKNSSFIDETVVTSDSELILSKAKKLKCTIQKRPKFLCRDNTNANEVIRHVLKNIKLSKNFIIIYLQPTSPFRNHFHINKAFKNLEKYSSTNLMSVKITTEDISKSFSLKKYLKPNYKKLVNLNRQNLKKFYSANGAIYIFSKYNFCRENKIPQNNIVPFIMNKIDSFDINDQLDYLISKTLYKKIIYN